MSKMIPNVINKISHKIRQISMDKTSVKQAIDNLPTGLAFSDNTGKIILMNRVFAELANSLIGSLPQTRKEIEDALKNPSNQSGVVKIEESPNLYIFTDGSIWEFSNIELEEPIGFTQTTAQNMTELYRGARQLRRDNETMRQVNENLTNMYSSLEEQVKEQENLDLKIRIHNNIGTSLLTLSNLLRGSNDIDMNLEIAILKNAVNHLSNDWSSSELTFDDVISRADSVNLSIDLDGNIPDDILIEGLLVSAVNECITNCIKHAGGNKIYIKITPNDEHYTITITNNGKIPKEPIVEGGGLSSLRRKIKDFGGYMKIDHIPTFTLTLILPRKGLY